MYYTVQWDYIILIRVSMLSLVGYYYSYRLYNQYIATQVLHYYVVEDNRYDHSRSFTIIYYHSLSFTPPRSI